MNSQLRIAAGILALLCVAHQAAAQTADTITMPSPPVTMDVRRAVEHIRFDKASNAGEHTTNGSSPLVAQPPKHRSVLATVGLVAAGVVAGFISGVYVGGSLDRYVLHPNCGCDDPGLAGAVIGGFSGAIVMPIVFLKFAK